MTSDRRTCVAVLGLGEAGSEISRDLVASGVEVRGYDPRLGEVPGPVAPDGLTIASSEADAASGADLVLSVNSAADARDALVNGLPGVGPAAVWAELNTSAPKDKRELGRLAAAAKRSYVDVALMSPVPGRGLRTPMYVSGEGAERFVALLRPLGADIIVVGDAAGDAATRKLLRSVFVKGMSAAVVEALVAARAAGLEEWLHEHIAEELAGATAFAVDRLVDGTHQHARRRAHEMAAAAALLGELGVPHEVTLASRDQLERINARSNPRRADLGTPPVAAPQHDVMPPPPQGKQQSSNRQSSNQQGSNQQGSNQQSSNQQGPHQQKEECLDG